MLGIMAAALTVRIAVLELETGVWCDRCALPSMVVVTYTLEVGSRLSIGSKTACRDCGAT